MGTFSLLVLSIAIFQFVYGSKCVPETAECSRFWVKMEPHRNLLESEEELDDWCRKQSTFYSCLEMALLGPTGNLSDLPTTLLISKMFSEDLCLEGSRSRQRYLDNAACINQLETEYCTMPEYLDIVTADDFIPPSRCSLSEKTFSCIAATMVMNCGFEAARVYRHLLKVMRYGEEVCDIESSEGVPPCRDPDSGGSEREKIPDIYYGLLNRFGDIPEQVDESDSSESYSETTKPDAVQVDESIIADVIREALDSIEEESSEEHTTVSDFRATELNLDGTISETEDEFIYRRPIITEPFKGLLHYNYSGREFAIYWKQSDLVIEKMNCNHLMPGCLNSVVFNCSLHRRLNDPHCLEVGRSQNEDLTPELVRDIDPDVPRDSETEFGPRPFWVDKVDEYKMQKELKELEKLSNPESLVSDSNAHTFASTPKITVDQDPDWWNCGYQFAGSLRKEILSVLLPYVHEDDMPLMSKAYIVKGVGYAYFFEDRLNNFEKIDCGRVKECYDVFKCTIKPRKNEQNRFCDKNSRYWAEVYDKIRNRSSSISSVSSDETESEWLKYYKFTACGASSENVATQFTDAETPVPEQHDSEDSMQSEMADSPDISLMILDPSVRDSEEILRYFEDFVPSEAEETAHEDSENYELASDGADSYRLLSENVLLLQPMSSSDNVETTYEIIQPEEDESLNTGDEE